MIWLRETCEGQRSRMSPEMLDNETRKSQIQAAHSASMNAVPQAPCVWIWGRDGDK